MLVLIITNYRYEILFPETLILEGSILCLIVNMIIHYVQVFLGHSGGLDTEGNELPRLVYVSREKRPGFQHHKKAGAMNALVST